MGKEREWYGAGQPDVQISKIPFSQQELAKRAARESAQKPAAPAAPAPSPTLAQIPPQVAPPAAPALASVQAPPRPAPPAPVQALAPVPRPTPPLAAQAQVAAPAQVAPPVRRSSPLAGMASAAFGALTGAAAAGHFGKQAQQLAAHPLVSTAAAHVAAHATAANPNHSFWNIAMSVGKKALNPANIQKLMSIAGKLKR